jgi:hypothetical protein
VGLLVAAMFVFGMASATIGTVASTVSQSAVARTELGVANGVNLFVRTVAASISVAIAGALFDARLGQQLARRVPAGAADPGDLRRLVQEPDEVRQLEPAVARAVIESIGDAVNRGFWWLIPVAVGGLLLTLVMGAEQLHETSPEGADVVPA